MTWVVNQLRRTSRSWFVTARSSELLPIHR